MTDKVKSHIAIQFSSGFRADAAANADGIITVLKWNNNINLKVQHKTRSQWNWVSRRRRLECSSDLDLSFNNCN